MAVAAVDYAMGSQQQNVRLPPWLSGRFEVFGVGMGRYRAFLIAICGVLVVALQLVLSYTRFGVRLRAAVDDRRVARGLGIPVNAVFAATFAVGSGLAGLGGALGAEILGLDPTFPLKFMIYFLIVVTVGSTAGLIGPFVAALVLGSRTSRASTTSRRSAFVIYTLMIVILLVRPQGSFGRAADARPGRERRCRLRVARRGVVRGRASPGSR
jgi:branched-chain amino acid transport system permease protein